MQTFSADPFAALQCWWQQRALVWALTHRDVVGRYRGSIFGILWSFLNPLFMLSVYTFVFSVVFKARWGANGDSRTDFALNLFAGLIVFNLFSECIVRSAALITQNVNYVKKVVFPIDVLPWVNLCSALFHGSISMLVWILFYICCRGIPPLQGLALPLVIVPLLLLTLGLSWLIASLGVFIRDIPQIVSLVISVLLFLSPVFYPISALPTSFQWVMRLNPLSQTIEQARCLLLQGQFPSALTYGANLMGSLLVAWGGFAWFQKTRRAFADVL
jgi:lipopolysaccharide transport system permease protein